MSGEWAVAGTSTSDIVLVRLARHSAGFRRVAAARLPRPASAIAIVSAPEEFAREAEQAASATALRSDDGPDAMAESSGADLARAADSSPPAPPAQREPEGGDEIYLPLVVAATEWGQLSLFEASATASGSIALERASTLAAGGAGGAVRALVCPGFADAGCKQHGVVAFFSAGSVAVVKPVVGTEFESLRLIESAIACHLWPRGAAAANPVGLVADASMVSGDLLEHFLSLAPRDQAAIAHAVSVSAFALTTFIQEQLCDLSRP